MKALNKMANSHARGDGMRIDDQVWNDTFLGKWHVLMSVGHSTGTFLAVTRGELVANLGNPNRSHFDFCEPIAILIGCQDNLVNLSTLTVFDLDRAVFSRLEYVCCCGRRGCGSIITQICCTPDQGSFANNDVISINDFTWHDDSVNI